MQNVLDAVDRYREAMRRAKDLRAHRDELYRRSRELANGISEMERQVLAAEAAVEEARTVIFTEVERE